MRKLSEALSDNKGIGPGFHFLRHILSVVILAYHSYGATIGINDHIPHAKGMLAQNASSLSWGQIIQEICRPGLYAMVGSFFALSGFLIAGSAFRTRNIPRFLWLRVLRIVPALTMEVTLSAIILGVAFTSLSYQDYFTSPDFYRYFGNIVGHVVFTLPGVFTHNPYPDVVNANLWTLPPEFYCYAFMVGLMATGIVFNRTRYLWLVIAGYAALAIISLVYPTLLATRFDGTHFTSWFIVLFYFVGILFYLFADKVPLHPAIFFACAAGYFVFIIFNVSDLLAAPMLVYCIVYAGMMTFEWFDKIVKGDYSYGIYLFGYPITQSIVAALQPFLATQHGLVKQLSVTLPALALTFLFAAFSWHIVEKPALKLKKMRLPLCNRS